jgi:hypothetical protein
MTFQSGSFPVRRASLILASSASVALYLGTTGAIAQGPVSKSTTMQSAPLTLADFEAGMMKAMQELENEPRFKGLPEAEKRERIDFVAGNVMFATAHEVGHMLVQEWACLSSGEKRTQSTPMRRSPVSGISTNSRIAC